LKLLRFGWIRRRAPRPALRLEAAASNGKSPQPHEAFLTASPQPPEPAVAQRDATAPSNPLDPFDSESVSVP
jgi:hypothetical protein